ncbi:MAG: fused MFS/spermidine synthase [Thaumarchaeota archaeon]|nr:fused MFS/spermidine synthase [Nitrososphaerota archaeon]
MAWRLRFDVFIAGAIVMALEIAGSRILAPFFGNTIFVWGSLIGVVLAALSLGYFLGGRLSDRSPSFFQFSVILLAAGISILVMSVASPLILEAVFSINLGDRYGPLLATSILLIIPGTLLGMVSPYAVKLSAEKLEKIGVTSGNIYSLSTVGSIFGTFMTVFILIPELGVRSILFALGLTLVAISLLGLDNFGRGLVVIIILIASVPALPLSLGSTFRSGDLVFEKDSPYNHIEITDDHNSGTRTLRLNGLRHSAMYLDGSLDAVFPYTDFFHLPFLFNPSIKEVLFIGGGGFTGPKKFLSLYEDVTIDVVEVDGAVVNAAINYFNVTDDPRLNIIVEDGRIHLTKTEKKYDLIVLDAYSKTYVPFHLMTQEFFDEVQDDLSPDGIVISNVIASVVGDTSDIFRAQYKTIGTSFTNVYVFPTIDSTGTVQNIMVLATKSFEQTNPLDLRPKTSSSTEEIPELLSMAGRFYREDIPVSDVPVLTDDYAPVEKLLNPVSGQPFNRDDSLTLTNAIYPAAQVIIWLVVGGGLMAILLTRKPSSQT